MFVKNRRYTPWIRDGSIRDWFIIDCRMSQLRSCSESTSNSAYFPVANSGVEIPETKLWRAACASDFSRWRYWVSIIKSFFHDIPYPILSLDVAENSGCLKYHQKLVL